MTEDELLSLMSALDAGTSASGPLTPETRARIYAAVGNPTNETWDDAHTIIIAARGFTTLWQAVLRHTGYSVTSKPTDDLWPVLPTSGQLLAALRAELLGAVLDESLWRDCPHCDETCVDDDDLRDHISIEHPFLQTTDD